MATILFWQKRGGSGYARHEKLLAESTTSERLCAFDAWPVAKSFSCAGQRV
jgi:hypothetical protein